jgi:hypothetical protein
VDGGWVTPAAPCDTAIVPSAAAWLLIAVLLLGPPLSVVGLVVWTRRLGKQGAPSFAIVVAYILSKSPICASVTPATRSSKA